MIIISQDKTELINFDNIVRLSVDVNANGAFLIEAHNFCDDFETVMGFYETEERAKEILQEIGKTYVLTEQYKVEDERTQINLMMEGVLLYEMPAE